MVRLAFLLYSIIGTTMAGIAMVVVLTLGWMTFPAIIAAVVLGAALALPVAWAVAKTITSRKSVRNG